MQVSTEMWQSSDHIEVYVKELWATKDAIVIWMWLTEMAAALSMEAPQTDRGKQKNSDQWKSV